MKTFVSMQCIRCSYWLKYTYRVIPIYNITHSRRIRCTYAIRDGGAYAHLLGHGNQPFWIPWRFCIVFLLGGCTTYRHGCTWIAVRFISTCQKPKAPWAILLILDVAAVRRPTISRSAGRKKICPPRILHFALVLSIFGLATELSFSAFSRTLIE